MNETEGQEKTATPAPYEQELEAMKAVAIALDNLDIEQRRRIHLWVSQRYRLGNW